MDPIGGVIPVLAQRLQDDEIPRPRPVFIQPIANCLLHTFVFCIRLFKKFLGTS